MYRHVTLPWLVVLACLLQVASALSQTPEPVPSTGPALQVFLPFDKANPVLMPARGSVEEAITFARRSGSLRLDEVVRYMGEVYRLAPAIGMDPAIIVAQSALETANWTSFWWMHRLNPAGMGVTGHPGQNSGSPGFASGTYAARAQLAHMHAEVFGNARPLPKVLFGADPTYQRVFDAGWAGTVRTLSDLSGTWAVDPRYGEKIASRATQIFR